MSTIIYQSEKSLCFFFTESGSPIKMATVITIMALIVVEDDFEVDKC